MSKTVPPLEARFQQRVRVNQTSRYCLHDLEDFHWIVDGLNLCFPHLENRKGDSEERLAAFIEEAIPDSERGFNGQSSDEAGHEPSRGAKSDRRKAHGL